MMLIYWSDINTIKKNTRATTPLDASKKFGLKADTEKPKYMFMPHHETTRQNQNKKIPNKSLENALKNDFSPWSPFLLYGIWIQI